MKILIIIAAILLSAGCTKNDGMTRMQQTSSKEKLNGTQASSITTTGAQKSTITVKQDPFTLPDLLSGVQVPGTGTATNPGAYPTNPTSPATNAGQYPGTNPSNNAGQYPVTNPGTSPATNAGQYPASNPGTNPSNNTGQYSGTNPATNTGQYPGTSPATNAGQYPAANPGENPAQKTTSSSPYEQQVLQLVNKQRAGSGLTALMMDDKLSQMALVKAQDMYSNNYFDHNSPTYGSPFQMMDKFQISYNSAGENIAKGQTSPEQVMNDWMNSEGHRANIMNNTYTKIGIGYYNGEWVQEFIS